MSRDSRAAAIVLTVTFAALFGLLILLSGGLGSVKLQPGTPIYMPLTESPEDEADEPTPLPPLSRRDLIVAYGLSALTGLSLVGVLISRRLRRQLFQQLFAMVAIALPVILVLYFVGNLLVRWLHQRATSVPDSGPLIPESLLTHPPAWALGISAIALALAVTGLIAYAAWRGARIRRALQARRARRDEEALRTQVSCAAADAARQIRLGFDPHSVVIRCYREMIQLLSERENMSAIYLTPREFKRALEDVGISDSRIAQLTEMFEFVRYGNRDDQGFASRAVACFETLQTAYADNQEVNAT